MKKRVTIIRSSESGSLKSADRAGESQIWCERCGVHAHLLEPEELAALAGLSSSQVFRLLEAGRHFTRIRTAGRVAPLSAFNSLRQTTGLLAGDEKPNDEEIENEYRALVK